MQLAAARNYVGSPRFELASELLPRKFFNRQDETTSVIALDGSGGTSRACASHERPEPQQ